MKTDQKNENEIKDILTYVRFNLSTFEEQPFTEVDSLVLSSLAYLGFGNTKLDVMTRRGVRLKDLYCSEYFESMFHGVLNPKAHYQLFCAVAASPRYRNVKISSYINELDGEQNLQFAAMTFLLTPELCYIAYRGTDSTYIGWKEDLMLSLNKPIYAQQKAEHYLNQVCARRSELIMLGGHSKGGNLATYAGARLSTEHPENASRLLHIFSHDGPGFSEALIEHLDFHQIEHLIHKTIPQSSLIGQVLYQETECHIVTSTAKGIAQHDPFSWVVEHEHFIYQEKLDADAQLLTRAINDWICNLEEEDKERFVESIFTLLQDTEVDTFLKLYENMGNQLPLVFKKAKEMDSDTRSFLIDQMMQVVQKGIKNVPELLQERKHKNGKEKIEKDKIEE